MTGTTYATPSVAPSPTSANRSTATATASVVATYGGYGLAALATFSAATPWARGYSSGALTLGLLVASLASVGVVLAVAQVARRSFFVSAAVNTLMMAAFVLVVVLREPVGFSSAAKGFTSGITQLLSNTLPLADTPALQVTPVVVCWITGATMAELLARGRSLGAPAAVAVASFGGAYAATAGGVGDATAASVVLLATLGALVFVRRWAIEQSPAMGIDAEIDGSRATRFQPLVFGAAAVAFVALACALVVPSLPPLRNPPARPDRKAPEERPEHIAPLADIAGVRQAAVNGGDSVVLTVTFDRATAAFVPLAQLDTYDGNTWRLDNVFLPTGGRIPDPATTDGGAASPTERSGVAPLDQNYTVRAPLPGDGSWMPFVSRPSAVRGVDVRYATASGMVMPVQPLAEGAAFNVVSVASTADLVAVVRAGGETRIDRRDRANAAVPQDLQTDLQTWLDELAKPTGARPEPTVAFLATMVDAFEASYFRTEESLDALASARAAGEREDAERTTTSPTTAVIDGTSPDPSVDGTTPASATGTVPPRINRGGTAFAEVSSAIGTGRSGTPEQYATLYALLARKLGVPARVVTGFRLRPVERVPQVVDPGTFEVKASQAWTWVEVATREHGWLAVDPTPTRTSVEAERDVKSIVASDASTTTSLGVAVAGTILKPVNTEVTRAVPPPAEGGSVPWFAVLGGLAILALLAVAPVYRLQRRASRQRGTPTEQAVGAWHETLDTLSLSGVTELRSRSNTEVVALTANRFGEDAGQAVGVVGGVANQAIFFDGGVREEDAARAWDEVDRLRAALRRAVPGSVRLRSAFRLGRGV